MKAAVVAPVTHVVFDVDGLLIDSEQYYFEAIHKVAKQFDREFTADMLCEMMGTKAIESGHIAIKQLGLKGLITAEEFVQQYEAELRNMCSKIRLMPGAERLITHLADHNIPIAIATGASESGFQRKTGHLGDILRKPFSHHVFAGSDGQVKRGKPFPDVFLCAAERFKPKPESYENVLVFEDATNGVNAALAAGMQVIFVPDKWTDLRNVHVKPTQTIKSLNDFKPELYGLPPWGIY